LFAIIDNEEIPMSTIKRLGAIFAIGGTTVAAMFFTSLAQAPQVPAAPVPTPPAPASPIFQSYQPVTAERLKNPDPANWLMVRRSYDGWGYSPLNQINSGNVSKLRPVWGLLTGEGRVHEAAAIVNSGVMFVSTPNNQVIALDAKTGDVLWKYRRPRPQGSRVAHDTSRGVALYGDKVYFAAGEAVIVALDAKTGSEVWTAKVAENSSGYYISLAPLVAGGVVMVGTSGGEFGVRGFVAGLDPDTGKELWRAYTIPAPGEPGSETWPQGGDHWKTGGGSIWVTGNYDPETNLAFWGTGNGGPWMGDQRPGDNLYTSSTVAIDVATGKIKGHFQYHPNDSWDWDEVSPPILVDYRRNGRTIKGLIDVARDGYLWFLERTDGPIKFVEGKPYVNQNVFLSLDPKTGRPEVDPARKPGTGKTADFCPGLHGGKNWPPIAFSPQTRMIYVPANNNICGSLTGAPVTYTPGNNFTGTGRGTGPAAPAIAPGADHFGEVQAWNVDTGQKVWTHNWPKSPNWGSMLATGGGLVFTGGTNDRKIHAFDAKNGKLLWESPTPSGILAPPTSFTVDGKQYIAVVSGWGGDSAGMQSLLNRGFPGQYPAVPEGGSIWVYALE
jgi:alcohol dehydrogenase (cytochrome c)